MAEMLILSRGGTNYKLSSISRSYQRSHSVTGISNRSITGKLTYRVRALKTVHNVSWGMLTHDTAPDGGIGLAELEALVKSGGEYTLTVYRYAESPEWETFTVILDPESFQSELVRLPGMKRRIWRVSLTMLEV